MKITKRVINSNLELVGYLLEDNKFYNLKYIEKLNDYIDNIGIGDKGNYRCSDVIPTIYYKDYCIYEYNKLLKENNFKRDIERELIDWKVNWGDKVLQVEGSRQVGKTTEILKFGFNNYENVIYVNLADDKYNFAEMCIGGQILPAFMNVYCSKANLPKYMDTRNTLLIIDEVQVNAQVYNSIRAIRDSLKCDIVVTGSYLGQTLKRDYFLPAGTIMILKFYPLSFREFCRVFDMESKLVSLSPFGQSSVGSYVELERYYTIYRQIGGYPEAVKAFRRTGKISDSLNSLRQLLDVFIRESRNYYSSESTKETAIFRGVFSQLAVEMSQEKRGVGNKLIPNVAELVSNSQEIAIKKAEVTKAINWLVYSGLVDSCDLCVEGDVLNVVSGRRLYYLDCGLLNCIAQKLPLKKSSIDGLITETFVYGELHRLYTSGKLEIGNVPCFSYKDGYELDFVLVNNNKKVIGLEVKTNRGSTKSLDYFKAKGIIDIKIVAQLSYGGVSGDKLTIPIYKVGDYRIYNRI